MVIFGLFFFYHFFESEMAFFNRNFLENFSSFSLGLDALSVNLCFEHFSISVTDLKFSIFEV